MVFDALLGVKNKRYYKYKYECRLAKSLLRECWLWKEPVWSRCCEQYTLLLKTSRVHSSKHQDQTDSSQSQHSLKRDFTHGCTRKSTIYSYVSFSLITIALKPPKTWCLTNWAQILIGLLFYAYVGIHQVMITKGIQCLNIKIAVEIDNTFHKAIELW